MSNLIKKISKRIPLCLIIIATFFSFISSPAYSASDSVYSSGPREITDYNSGTNMCNTTKLDFNPFGGSDIRWELDNSTCIAYVAAQGGTLLAARVASSIMCYVAKAAIYKSAQLASGIPLNVMDISAQQDAAAKCSSLTTACSASIGFGGPTCGQASSCCSSWAVDLAVTASAVASLAIIYAAAEGAHEKARICGHDWNVWSMQNGKMMFGKYPGSYQKQLEDKVKGNTLKPFDISNQQYREYLYGGIEYEDNGANSCQNPWSDNKDLRKQILGYDSDNQKYYMRGSKLSANVACQRFLYRFCQRKNNENDTDFATRCKKEKSSAKDAFDCCNNRSQEILCIENNSMGSDDLCVDGANCYEHKFCKNNSKCTVKGITFEVYDSRFVNNYLCAKTYSVCPYNHLLGGGTEIADAQPDGTNKNYCQYLKHCARVPDKLYVSMSELDGAYISSACYDMTGDSQNNYSYDVGILPLNNRHFSAPMAQCFRETFENLFLHRAGHSVCKDPNETPQNDICISGYYYQKGDRAPGSSFFENIQTRLQSIIKLFLIMAVTILGINILLAGKVIEKKTILVFLVKFALIGYFALGNAWQTKFFDGVYNGGMVLADLVMRVDEGLPPDQLDGCQFPKYNYADSNQETTRNNPAYPPGKEYLRIWDMFDCKIAKALGFGPEATVPNIIKMIIGGFFTGGLGIIFIVAGFFFAFFLISLVIRALHIFLLSSISIILMIYVSPLIITLSLFKKTEGIFKSWVKNLLSFTLQPMILFAYLGILITAFDNIVVGSAKFSGDSYTAPKELVCNSAAENDSLYCIFRIADFENFTGLEPIGIGIPVLLGLNQEKLGTIIKAAFIFFILTNFIDQITSVAATLTMGAELKTQGPSAFTMATKTAGILGTVQTRGMGAVQKWGGKSLGKTRDLIKAGGQALGKKKREEKDRKSPTDSSSNPAIDSNKDDSSGGIAASSHEDKTSAKNIAAASNSSGSGIVSAISDKKP